MQQQNFILAQSIPVTCFDTTINTRIVSTMPPHALQTEQLWDVDVVESLGPLNERKFTDNRMRPPGKSISFSETVTFREIEPLTELTKDEIRNVWYDDDEYIRIKKEVTATVKKSADGDSIEEEEGYCMRGLEGRTKFGAKRRKNNKAAGLEAVWSTQVLLWKKKIANHSAIAAAYRPHALHAKYPAMQTGYKDEMFVRQHVRNNLE
jgi:hypothetical protein